VVAEGFELTDVASRRPFGITLHPVVGPELVVGLTAEVAKTCQITPRHRRLTSRAIRRQIFAMAPADSSIASITFGPFSLDPTLQSYAADGRNTKKRFM
jgi:hypothetical protein